MMMHKITFPILFLTFLYVGAETPELVTDRPDQTESASTVPFKHIQIETGFVYESDKTSAAETTNITYNGTLFRYGLAGRMELRLGLEYLNQQVKPLPSGQRTETSGAGPVELGSKILITKEEGFVPQSALLLSVTLPDIGLDEFIPAHPAPAFRFALERGLTERIGLGCNLGMEWDGQSAAASGYYSLAAGFALLDRLGAFAEIYGSVPEEDGAEMLADAGLTYLVKDNAQLDVSAGAALTAGSPDWFVSAGLSVRIPR